MFFCSYVVWDRNIGFPITWVLAEPHCPKDWAEAWYKHPTTDVKNKALLNWEEITEETYHIIAKAWPEVVLKSEFLAHDFSHLDGVYDENNDGFQREVPRVEPFGTNDIRGLGEWATAPVVRVQARNPQPR